MESISDDLMTARQTAARLEIRLETLYAYVSRGLLQSVAVAGSRERCYRAVDIERFRAARGGKRGARAVAEALAPVIGSALSLIEHHRLFYRGEDALRLAEHAGLEEVAALLWAAPEAAFPAPAAREEPGMAAGTPRLGLIERCQVRLARLGSEDLAALDLSPAGIVRSGGRIVGELAACVGGACVGDRAPVHRRLAAGWGLDGAGAEIVRRCLVLLADHELNASTFVARCVASTGATPYAAVAGALAALSGRRHGGAAARAEALFRELGNATEPMPALAARLARGEDLPGLGQPLYPDGDPRARAIISALAASHPQAGARVEAAAAAALRLTGQQPNVDFALGAASVALGLPPGGALAIFVVARAVGWIAHAIEQYQSGVLIRPRARYTGTRPAGVLPSPG